MKQVLIILLIVFWTVKALGQQSVDVGIYGGAGTYFGDMTKIEFKSSLNPAYGGFLRYNFNPRYGLRFNVVNGSIGATGEYDYHPWNFKKNVFDVSLLFEFNFLKYIIGEKETPWTTYIFCGIGMQTYNYQPHYLDISAVLEPNYLYWSAASGPVMTPTIPFGLGVKLNLSKRWGLGIEGSMRKTFSDKLDNLDDPLSYETADHVQIKYTDNMHNNDWTAYMGISLVYKMIYGNKEWVLLTPRKKIIDWGIWNSIRKE